MVDRLPEELKTQTFDWVVILAGTNNLASTDPEELFESLETLHTLAREKGAKTIAVTIPGETSNFSFN